MNPPWKTQLASDVVRDGLGVELLNERGQVVAEVFRCDADHSVKMRVFDDRVQEYVLQELLKIARSRLDAFEDGTPLPDTFERQSAASQAATAETPHA